MSRVSSRILGALRARHPEVRLRFDKRRGSWGMWQEVGRMKHHIAWLGSYDDDHRFRPEHPTMQNTVMVLDTMRPDQFGDRWKIDRMLEGVDVEQKAADEEVWRKNKDQRREQTGDLYDRLMVNKIWVPRA